MDAYLKQQPPFVDEFVSVSLPHTQVMVVVLPKPFTGGGGGGYDDGGWDGVGDDDCDDNSDAIADGDCDASVCEGE